MTTNEITKELQEESLTIKVGKRKRYNLKNRGQLFTFFFFFSHTYQ